MSGRRDVDVRDEALSALLDRTAERIEEAPSDRLPEVLRRGSRRRTARLAAIGAAVGVFAGAVGWAGLSLPSEDAAIPADVGDWRTVGSLEEDGWTLQAPPPWRIQEVGPCEGAVVRRAVILTNVDVEFRDRRGEPIGCWEGIVWAGFPPEGVALLVQPEFPRGPLLPRVPVTPFPLTPESLGYRHQVKGGPLQTMTSVQVPRHAGPVAMVSRWVGPVASAADVEALDRTLASLQVRGGVRWIDDEVTTVDEFPDLTVTIRRPETWRIETYPTSDVIDAPNPIVALRSPGLGRGPCQLAFFTRTDRFADADLLVLISDATESWTAPDLGPRPDAFRFDDAIDNGGLWCGTGRTFRWGFEEAGRQIHVDVAVGEWFYRERPEMILEILDSIEIRETG
jgi:hypothetical protein